MGFIRHNDAEALFIVSILALEVAEIWAIDGAATAATSFATPTRIIMDPATVTIQLTAEDIKRFQRFAGKESKSNYGSLIFFAVVILVMAASFFMTPDAPKARAPKHDDKWAGAIPVVIFVGAFYYFYRQQKKAKKEDPNAFLYRPHTYEVRERGLYCETERGEMLHYWKAVTRFAETDQDFFVMVSRDSGHILPKRCFPSQEAAAIFANQLRLRLEDYTPLRSGNQVLSAANV